MVDINLPHMDETDVKDKLEDILATFLKDNFIKDGKIIGYFDDLETFSQIVERMREKGFAYSVRDSDIRKKVKSKSGHGSESEHSESYNGQESEFEKNDFNQHTIFYQLKVMSIKFFGLPFTIEKTTHYQCAYGRKYYKSRAGLPKKQTGDMSITLPMKKRRNIVSKKMGCLARMTLKKIIVYPQYKLEVESDWRKKKNKIRCLRKDLTDKGKSVESFCRYYLSASIQSSHNHPPMVSIMQSPRKQKRVRKNSVKNKRKSCDESLDVKEIQWDASFPSGSLAEPESSPSAISVQDTSFLSTLVKFPATTYEESEIKPITIGLEISGLDEPTEEKTFQIQTIQYQPSPQDLQNLFRDRLKRLYTLSENCFNSPLLLRLISDLEQIELALHNDIIYDPNAI